MRDPAGLAYAAIAVVFAWVAVVAWRRRANNPVVGAAMTVGMAGACWWSVTLAVSLLATNQTVEAIATASNFPGSGSMVAAFACLGIAIARPQWVPRRRLLLALVIEPTATMLAVVTNPWHLLVYRGAGVAQLTGSAGWTYGPVYWLDTWYGYLLTTVGLAWIAVGWWRSPPGLRRQRLVLLLAGTVPLAVNVAFFAGGFGGTLDPTLFGFAVSGVIMTYSIFRRDLLTFTPVARALIVDQVGDAVVVVSPSGRVLDLNPAAVILARALTPGAPAKLVGVAAALLFGKGLVRTGDWEPELVVELPGGHAEFHVQASALVDRRHRDLGTVFVARDVTEANALIRRLAVAHTQLVAQVKTIDVLRANLVDLASRDPLTNLHNRRHLVERFAEMLAAADPWGTLAVALFDVDKFKSINDRFGHLAGDAVLVALARRMQEQAPAGALVARWGGEEFFVALPGADADQGLAFADALRSRCEQHATVVDGREIRCTISGGVATYPASGTTMDDLFHAADHAMYQAKNAGRNVVRLDVAEVPSRRTPGSRA